MRHLASTAQKVLLCLLPATLLFSSLLGCGELSIGSERSGDVDTNTETQEVGDGAQVNQPETVVVSGGSTSVDSSNRPLNNPDETDAGAGTGSGAAGPCLKVLWKPISESTGTLAIVGDPRDVILWSAVSVIVAETGELEFGESTGFSPEGQQIWRFDLPGGQYTGDYTIDYSGTSCSARIPNPARRSDAQVASENQAQGGD